MKTPAQASLLSNFLGPDADVSQDLSGLFVVHECPKIDMCFETIAGKTG